MYIKGMYLKEIWRYPVKSMAGESLQSLPATLLGLEGDRTVLVTNGHGRIITSRSHPRLLGHKATLSPNGLPLVDGRLYTEDSVLADVRSIAGPAANFVRDKSANRFDILPLLVATDGAIEAFGRDSRRLRPNLIIGGVAGLAERQWPGRKLRIGTVVIDLDSLRGRCVMTTYDPDTLHQDLSVLKDIVRRFDGELALNASIQKGGILEVGQEVELL